MENIEYIIRADTIIFESYFNKNLDEYHKILIGNGIKKIIFSDYKLDGKIIDYYLIAWDNWNVWDGFLLKDKNKTFSLFNKSIDNLPINITHIFLGHFFSQPVENLSSNITYLFFGINFNQPIKNLPSNLTNLIFGTYFNFPVDNLPSSITNLIFGSYFNFPVDNLPYGIKSIKFGKYSRYNLDLNCLPNSVEEIFLPSQYTKCIQKIPSQLKKICCYEKYPFANYFKKLGIEVSIYGF